MSQLRNVIMLPIVVLLVVACSVDIAQAQRLRGFRFGVRTALQLISLKEVQGELKLKDDIKTKATEISEKLSEERRELFSGDGDRQERFEKYIELIAKSEESLEKLLNEKQNKRLREIQIQVNGAITLTEKDVVKALKISDEQKSKLEEVDEANSQEILNAWRDSQGASREERREKIAELRKEANQKLLAVITDDQRAAFEKLQGKKLKIDLTPLQRRRNN